MEDNEADPIQILHDLSLRVGLVKVAEYIQQHNNNGLELLNGLRKQLRDNVSIDNVGACNKQWLDYGIYGIISECSLSSEIKAERPKFELEKSPFAVIFGSLFVDNFKRIKKFAVENNREQFESCIYHFTQYISALAVGDVDRNFYKDLGPGDYKRLVFLIRTTLSFFCDKNIDKIYSDYDIPIKLVFQWAKCIVNIVKILETLNPKYIAAFEQDVTRDLIDIVQLPLGTNAMLFSRTVKDFEAISEGIEIKQPEITVNPNSILIMAALQSELLQSCKIGAINSVNVVEVDLKASFEYANGMRPCPTFPLVYMANKACMDIIYKCSYFKPALNSKESVTYYASLLKSFIYIKFGFCDLSTPEHFLKTIFKEPKVCEYNSCYFLDWIDTKIQSHGQSQYSNYDHLTLLQVLRTLSEVLFCIQGNIKIQEWVNVLEICRICLFMNMYYYKFKIQACGIAPFDVDFYNWSFKYWMVFMDNFKYHVSDEIMDIAICNLLIIIKVQGPLMQEKHFSVMPRVILKNHMSIKANGMDPFKYKTTGSILRISSISYTCCKSLLLRYLEIVPLHLETMKIVLDELKRSNAQEHSIMKLREQKLEALFKSYSEIKGGKATSINVHCFDNGLINVRGTGIHDVCFFLPKVDERSICLICLGVEFSLRALYLNDTSMLQMCFVFINTFTLIMLDIEQVLGVLKQTSRECLELIPLVLETYFHIQMITLDNLDANIATFISRNISICDAIIHFMAIGVINNGIQRTNDSIENTRWLSFVLLLRCIIASPRKNIFQVITTLISMSKANADSSDTSTTDSNKPPSLFDEVRNGNVSSKVVEYVNSRVVMERLTTHALSRYLSHVIFNILERQKKSCIIEGMNSQHISTLYKTINAFIQSTRFNDANFSCIHIFECLLILSKLFNGLEFGCMTNLASFISLNEVVFKGNHSVAHAVPLVSDYVNHPFECTLDNTVNKHVPLFSLTPPRSCFYCNAKLESQNPHAYYYFVPCHKCGYPCPLISRGEIGLNNIGQNIFVKNGAIAPLGYAEKVMCCIIKNAEMRSQTVMFILDEFLDNLDNLVNCVISLNNNEQELAVFMEDISSIIAMYIISVPVPVEKVFSIIGKLKSTSSVFSTVFLEKVEMCSNVIRIAPEYNYLEFFKQRFDDYALLLTDSTLDYHQMKMQYAYDCYMLRIYTNNIDAEGVILEQCAVLNKRQSLLYNLGISSISQLFMIHLDNVLSNNPETLCIDAFAFNLFVLSKFANAFNICLNKCLRTGLCASLVDKVESKNALYCGTVDYTSCLYRILLNTRTRQLLSVSFDHPFGQIMPPYKNLLGNVEQNDYALFRLLLDTKELLSNSQNNSDFLRAFYKFRFHAFIRLLWYSTNPHLIYKLALTNGDDKLLELQSSFLYETFGAYLEMKRDSLCISKTEHINSDVTMTAFTTSGNNALRLEQTGSVSNFVEENFVRILELFVTVWSKGTSRKNLTLKVKRLFYPDMYVYNIESMKLGCQMGRVFKCLVILLHIYANKFDVFCDRIIEALTIGEITKYTSQPLLECWMLLSEKLTLNCLGKYAPGIVYHTNKILNFNNSPTIMSIVDKIQQQLKARLQTLSEGKMYCSYLDSIINSFHKMDISIVYDDLHSYAMLIYPTDDQPKLPYITREAGAFAASAALSRNVFIQTDDQYKKNTQLLATAALMTISEFSDDLAKSPTLLANICCCILGYLQCDLNGFRSIKRNRNIEHLPTDDLNELAIIVLKQYLVPNMHLNITSYCMQEMLKLLGFRITCKDDETPVVENSQWDNLFDQETQSRLEPYRRTNFLRNKQIEAAIEHQLEANTIIDIKCLVWWIIKMLPQDAPKLPVFKACDLAMVQIPAVLSFLLPHIISSSVQLLDTQRCMDIGKRISLLLSNVLHKDSNTFGIHWKSHEPGAETLSFELRDHYTSCQAIFSLIDDIKFLVDKNSKLLESITEKQERDSIVKCIKRYKAILSAIPDLLVAQAAISCGSYARGVMIIEHHLTFEALSFDFSNPSNSLENVALRCKLSQSESTDSNAIISLLCRGYCGLSEWDVLLCLSGLGFSTRTGEYKTKSKTSPSPINKVKQSEDIRKAFSLECKGQYKSACEIYNSLLKQTQNPKLWTCWYRIIQQTGPNVFIQFPIPIQAEKSSDSLFAESITACWKLSLWDELDEILSRHGKSQGAIPIEINASNKPKFVITNADERFSFSNNEDTFWASLLMRDSVDVWFMEKIACSFSLMHKLQYEESGQLLEGSFKHMVRPLGLAIRESTQVAEQYLEKITIINMLQVVTQFNQKTVDEFQECQFASSLIKRAQIFAKNRCKTLVNILGAAKVALELGGKLKAASDLSLFLTKMCRLSDMDIHIPGIVNLIDNLSISDSQVVVERALTLQNSGDVDGAIRELKKIVSTDFNGLYNLVKIYSESNLLIPKVAVLYMHQLLQLAPNSYKANLLYATYLDRLVENRIKNAQNIKLTVNDAKVRSRKAHRGIWGETLYILTGIEGIPGMYSFVELVGVTICGYLRSLCFLNPKTDPRDGQDEKSADDLDNPEYIESMNMVSVLTRVITIMCFYCTANTKQFCCNVSFEKEACEMFFKSIHQRIKAYQDKFPQYYWYSVLSQLVSRCQHNILGDNIFQPIISHLLAHYPKQTLWFTTFFNHSFTVKNKQIHNDIIRAALGIKDNVNKIIECYDAMFTEMHKVAMDTDVSIKEISAVRFDGLWKFMNSRKTQGMILMPTRQNLSFEHLNYEPNDLEQICGLSENMQVLRSKQKPKKIGILTQSGQCLSFLIKNETKGDLRKDMRMMEATDFIVRLLQNKQLGPSFQCYNVIPLSELSGIIEWVPNMSTMRCLVLEELMNINQNIENETRPEILKYAQHVSAKKFTESLEIYNTLLKKRPPVLHRVYWKIFKKDPAEWYKCRRNFIYTCALWNMFGYIVGLGDRHAENILLNLQTGQVMHVDFDCLFGKGIMLQIPELVPFRLTQNIVSNLGICGTSIDGPYYSDSLRFLKFLQLNGKKLTAILMSFVFDPLIDWNNGIGGRSSPNHSLAQKALLSVEDKLRGIVHVMLPSLEISRLTLDNQASNNQSEFSSYKEFENVAEPLEPRQQLQQLIQAATSPTHLSKMFVGWAPWL
ncbi:bifunctional Phosphatidylinositol 3--4-kinase [Babesia duncani]|uniref:Serine/threonine-protein kinase ATR n=1 Tax=Babesia duncani TaxID=323732 RepID=A0AAD9PIS4_9APIC|nr:bifunctional Phosphatidylinositol 3--4-kinase [Babesia duncani]